MSRQNVDAFWRVIDAVNRGDAESVLRLAAEDIVVIPIRAATEGAYHGHDGVRAFFADNAVTFELFHASYSDVRDLGDRVLAIGTLQFRGKGSGVETDTQSAGIVCFEAGKVTRWEDFGDRGRALEAAGLPPE